MRGAVVLLAGQVCGQAASFVRNLAVARMVAADDFGVASTFAITMSLLDMLGDLAVDKLLVQARDGDDERVQATAHFVQFARGAAAGAALFVLADVFAAAFHVPQARWAYRTLALVPVIGGAAHLDVRRFQRKLRYLPTTAVDALPQIVATAAVWPLARWLGDWRVVLACVLLQAATTTLLSHAFAERRYAWSRDPLVIRRIFAFGWPLVVNALLMFAIFQGDRIVVATSYSLADLGAYSLAFSITFVPTSILARVATALALPLLSRAQDDAEQFRRHAAACAQAVSLAAALVAVPLVGIGGALIVSLFGTKYAAAADVMPWLAAMQAVRMLRVAPVLAAVARADTVNSMLSNAWRTLALGAMALLAARHTELRWIAAAGLGGEIVALVYSAGRLRRRHGLPLDSTLAPCAVALSAVAAAVAWTTAAPDAGLAATSAVVAVVLVGVVAALPGPIAAVRRAAAGSPALRDVVRAAPAQGPPSS